MTSLNCYYATLSVTSKGESTCTGMERGRSKITYEKPPNFLQRLGNSLFGALFGFIFVLGGSMLLFWNEGRAVQTYQTLEEARNLCHEIKDPFRLPDSRDGGLLAVSGPIAVSTPVRDDEFGIQKHAAMLRRVIQMYQWVEETRTRESKEADGTIRKETEYSYTPAWRSDLVSSRGYDDLRYTNPSEFPVQPQVFFAHEVKLGVFTLSRDVLLKFDDWKTVSLSLDELPQNLYLKNNMFYSGDPDKPKVGDVRVSFEYTGDAGATQFDEVTVVASLGENGVLKTYRLENGGTFLLVHMQKMSMQEVFDKEHASNVTLTWILRAVGWLIIFIGCSMTSRILVTIVDWLPFIHELVAITTSIFSAVISLSIASMVIAVAWLRYRPLLAALVILIAGLPYMAAKIKTLLTKTKSS